MFIMKSEEIATPIGEAKTFLNLSLEIDIAGNKRY